MVNQQDISAHLATIIDVTSGDNLVKAGMIGGIALEAGHVQVVLEVDPQQGASLEPLRQHVEQSLTQIPGISRANVILSARRSAPATPRKAPPGKITLPGIKSVIAIASGKGGVGKSTVSVNLAVALAAQGLRVGLLDADIYGPSLPMMMGITEKPKTDDDGNVLPIIRHGVHNMSIGFMARPDQALIWRGPMVQGALMQLIKDVVWGDLDVLLIDLPPGTGDIQLTLCQQVPLTGAVIVSTPQDIALIDARKAIAMFTRVNVPVLGMVENMAHFCCPACGHRSDIFGHGGARAEADSLQVPFLGEIPLSLPVRIGGDQGTPVAAPDSGHAEARKAFTLIAETFAAHLGALEKTRVGVMATPR